MSLGLHKINRKRALPRGEVGISPLTSPKSKVLSAANPNDPNKRILLCECGQQRFEPNDKCWPHMYPDVMNKKVLYFTSGDSFKKVRGMINLMRSKVKTKFARKKKKG